MFFFCSFWGGRGIERGRERERERDVPTEHVKRVWLDSIDVKRSRMWIAACGEKKKDGRGRNGDHTVDICMGKGRGENLEGTEGTTHTGQGLNMMGFQWKMITHRDGSYT